MTLNLWKALPSKIKRAMTIVVFFVVSVLITVAGILYPLSDEEVNELGRGLKETQNTVKNLPPAQKVSFIFGNNFMISLAGFVPIIGPIFECYALYSTGVVIAAYSTYEHFQISPLLLFALLFLWPFTWLEFLAYSTAVAESFWLTWRILQRKGKREIKNACMLISICAVMLLVAAIIETALLA